MSVWSTRKYKYIYIDKHIIVQVVIQYMYLRVQYADSGVPGESCQPGFLKK